MSKSRQILLLSSSSLHGFEFLQHAKKDMCEFLNKNNVKKVLFVPFALAKWDEYTKKIFNALEPWGYLVEGIHKHSDQVQAVKNAECIYIGGGNTFMLLKTLYENHLVEAIRARVLEQGIPYIGSSAGSNVATLSIHTTNDMPITNPPTFYALQLVNFNINAHFLDVDPDSKHKGETREERIMEYVELTGNVVLGIREGSSLLVDGDNIKLIGTKDARFFQKGLEPREFVPNSDMSFLLTQNKA